MPKQTLGEYSLIQRTGELDSLEAQMDAVDVTLHVTPTSKDLSTPLESACISLNLFLCVAGGQHESSNTGAEVHTFIAMAGNWLKRQGR